ncbi:hypothetical protein BB559_001063 [Furculomyces boomerangus]|uniref:RRM domain-containing protein n=2 Tax=Harpellales TaxID=61421 RepID=A0A2T9Z331_9FUNG|nr:hypothetical protein BB559_001063 [Furculomyces boomerangus]PWA00318.1 hypothetical protein BB558_003621 [Smittium angustum]
MNNNLIKFKVFFDRAVFNNYETTKHIYNYFGEHGKLLGFYFFKDPVTKARVGIARLVYDKKDLSPKILRQKIHYIPGMEEFDNKIEIIKE